MRRDTRATRKNVAIFVAAGLAAIFGQRLIEPKVKKVLKVRR